MCSKRKDLLILFYFTSFLTHTYLCIRMYQTIYRKYHLSYITTVNFETKCMRAVYGIGLKLDWPDEFISTDKNFKK